MEFRSDAMWRWSTEPAHGNTDKTRWREVFNHLLLRMTIHLGSRKLWWSTIRQFPPKGRDEHDLERLSKSLNEHWGTVSSTPSWRGGRLIIILSSCCTQWPGETQCPLVPIQCSESDSLIPLVWFGVSCNKSSSVHGPRRGDEPRYSSVVIWCD